MHQKDKKVIALRKNILKILDNIDAIFKGAYLHYKDVPKETIFEISFAESGKLRTGKVAEIEEEEKNINNKLSKEYFTNHQSPSDMYKKLRETEGARNEDRVYVIKVALDKMKKIIEYCHLILLNVFFTLINKIKQDKD